MRLSARGSLFFLMLIALCVPAVAQLVPPVPPPPQPPPPRIEDVNIITVEGRGDTQEAALKDALRQAVEKGAGQFIHSQTETKDYQVVLDKILSKSAGFVKSYEPNPPKYVGPDASGIITCKITATVAVKEVATEWGEIQILLQQKNKPRLMVVIGEKVDSVVKDDSTAASEIEKQLLKNDFPLIDMAQFSEVQRRDLRAAAFEDDLDKVVALGKQFGAEVIIKGSAEANFGGVREGAPDVRLPFYDATVKVRVVRTDNSAVLFSDNVSVAKGRRDKAGAAQNALVAAGVEMARKVQDGIVAKWGREVAEGQSVNLEVANVTYPQRSKLTEAIKKLPKVKGVQERTFANKVAGYTVDITGSADDLAKALCELKEWKIEITEATANGVKCKLPKEE